MPFGRYPGYVRRGVPRGFTQPQQVGNISRGPRPRVINSQPQLGGNISRGRGRQRNPGASYGGRAVPQRRRYR